MGKSSANGKGKRLLVALGALLCACFLVSLCVGRYFVPLKEAAAILCRALGLSVGESGTAAMRAAVLNIRLPRVLLACLVGCSLSAAGASYQSAFQNPMASPDILGASSGAAFGAALGIVRGASGGTVMLCAFGFGLVTVLLAYGVGRRAAGKTIVNLILCGMMISSLFSAGTSYIKLVADPSDQLPAITYWLMGSLSGTTGRSVLFAAIPMALGLVPLLLVRWRLNLLSLGDDEARAMGVRADRLRLWVVLCATLITSAGVAVCGVIGWVGLIIPHVCRKLFGNDHRLLLPGSMLAGALFLLLIDNVSRNLLPTEIPLGILTAFLGVPFFLGLILRKETTL